MTALVATTYEKAEFLVKNRHLVEGYCGRVRFAR